MTTTSPSPTSVPFAARPAWQRLGGGGILLAAILLFVATILEYVYWVPAGADSAPLLVAFIVTFSLSSLLYLVAVFPLAFGSTGSNGIVGRSVVGKIGSIGFGALFFALQAIYLVSVYFTEGDTVSSAVTTVSLVVAVLQYVSALTAAIVVIRAGIATGAARWSLLIAIIVGAVCGAIVQATDSFEVITIAYTISTIVQAFLGISYLVAKPATAKEPATA